MKMAIILVSMFLSGLGTAATTEFKCSVDDFSKTSEGHSFSVDLPSNGPLSFNLDNGESQLRLNNYEGQLFIDVRNVVTGQFIDSSSWGTYGSLNINNPRLAVSCTQK